MESSPWGKWDKAWAMNLSSEESDRILTNIMRELVSKSPETPTKMQAPECNLSSEETDYMLLDMVDGLMLDPPEPSTKTRKRTSSSTLQDYSNKHRKIGNSII